MQRKGKAKILLGVCLVLVLALALPLTSACAPAPAPAPAPAGEPIMLKAVGWTNPIRLGEHGLNWVADRLYSRSSGQLKLDFRGGSEAIPSDDQAAALQQGIVDLLWHHAGAWENVPQMNIVDLARHNADGTHPQEIHDFLNELFEPLGVRWLGQMRYYGPWYIALNTKIETLADLKGLSIMLPPTTLKETWLRTLGTEPIYITEGEEFSSLQSGLGDGLLVIVDDWKLGLPEVTKYLLLPSWRWGSNTSLLMNLETWNSLSPELQAVVEDVVASVIRDGVSRDLGNGSVHLQTWFDAGVEPIYLKGADAETYAASYAESAAWPDMLKKAGQEQYDRMRQLAKLGEGSTALPS